MSDLARENLLGQLQSLEGRGEQGDFAAAFQGYGQVLDIGEFRQAIRTANREVLPHIAEVLSLVQTRIVEREQEAERHAESFARAETERLHRENAEIEARLHPPDQLRSLHAALDLLREIKDALVTRRA